MKLSRIVLAAVFALLVTVDFISYVRYIDSSCRWRVLFQQGDRELQIGNVSRARLCYDKALELSRSFDVSYTDRAIILTRMAKLERLHGRLCRSAGLLMQAIQLVEKTQRDDLLSAALASYALDLRASGRYEEEEIIWRRLEALDIRAFGTESPELARDLHGMAGCSWRLRREHISDGYYLRALAVYRKLQARLDRATEVSPWQDGELASYSIESCAMDYCALLRKCGRGAEADRLLLNLRRKG